MMVHLLDGTYELFRHYYGRRRFEKDKRVPMDVKVGDQVLFGKYSGTEVTLDGEQLLILRESDVLAVMN